MILNVIPPSPSTLNILIGQLYYRRSPAKNTAVRGLQVHGCLNKTQPNSRELRREGGQGRQGDIELPTSATCGLLSPLSPVAFLVFLSLAGELGVEYPVSPAVRWLDYLEWEQIEGLKATIIILPHHSQSGRPE